MTSLNKSSMQNIKGKKRNTQHIIGEKGVNVLKNLLPDEWVVREYNPDYGIDLGIELFERMGDGLYKTKGEHVLFQVKGTTQITRKNIRIYNRINVEKEYKEDRTSYSKMEVVKYQIDTDLLVTVEKMGSAFPVLLTVVDITNQKAYFVCLNDYIEKIIYPQKIDLQKQNKITINIPVHNCINSADGQRIIEWYGKRAKLYAFFNKVNYQASEMRFLGEEYYAQQTAFFFRKLNQLDVWSAGDYFPWLKDVKQQIDYFLENDSVPLDEEEIKRAFGNSKSFDIDAEEWISPFSSKEISFREAHLLQSLAGLWNQMNNLASIFEEYAKEYYLPTPLFCSSYQ